jgi:hypothetical protein
MKQCPTCHRPFDYELLKFCRFDGSRLVSATSDEATTMLLLPVELSDKPSVKPSARKGEDPPERQ